MVRLFSLLLLLFTQSLLYGQKLDAWITKELEQDPKAYLYKTAKKTPSTPAEAAGNLFALGRCYHYLNQEDIALKYYLLSKKDFEALKLEEPAKDISLEIHQVISSQKNYDKYGNSFLDEYFAYAKKTNSEERLANAYNEFAKNTYATFDFENRSNISVLDSTYTLFKTGLDYAHATDNKILRAKLYSNMGALENTRQNFTSSRQYYDKARKLLINSDEDFEIFKNYFNYGNSYFTEGNYTDAITWFLKAEQKAIPKFRNKALRALYSRLMDSYDDVNDQPNRKKYQELYFELDEQIKDEEQNIAIHDINVKYEVAKKDRQISSLESFKNKFYKNRLIFGILLFLVFLLALYSFIRWKKLDQSKKQLETQNHEIQAEKEKVQALHTQTVQELEKVKNIVTEGHIILKDKTKVYLNDLMYVKSDDHYLNAYTQDGKKHFVRGKLSQILLELPPNFVKCHRSYIVNTNYIQSLNNGVITLKDKTEIPVSRNFKL